MSSVTHRASHFSVFLDSRRSIFKKIFQIKPIITIMTMTAIVVSRIRICKMRFHFQDEIDTLQPLLGDMLLKSL